MAAALSTPMVQSVPLAAAREATTAGPPARFGLLRRCGMWLRRLNTARALREIEPRLARDVGVSPGADRCPDGYAVDPRPLWGIGQTPRPVVLDALPAWRAADAQSRRWAD